jgi:hypothetical protein
MRDDTRAEVVHVSAEAVTPPTAEWCVQVLENCGGSLSKWRDSYPANLALNLDDEQLITRTEQWLASLEDKSLLRRWNQAIKHNQIVRLKLLQNKALKRIESLVSPDNPDWYKVAKEATAFKMILADLLAGQTFQAKQKLVLVEENNSDDDPDLDEIMAGA